MSFVRGGGKQGNKQQLINGLLGFKLKIQERDVREHLYAQYLAVRHTATHACTRAHTHTLGTRSRARGRACSGYTLLSPLPLTLYDTVLSAAL